LVKRYCLNHLRQGGLNANRAQSVGLIPLVILKFFSDIFSSVPSTAVASTIENKLSLPSSLRESLDALIVERKGLSKKSYMITEDITGYVSPNKVYEIQTNGLQAVSADSLIKHQPTPASMPPQTILEGHWHEATTYQQTAANILGDMCLFEVKQPEVAIPAIEATPEYLAYYDARLYKIGDLITFEVGSSLPITHMNIGENYVQDYLLQKNLGGGAYLEQHDLPHFHMPLDEEAKGYLILGKKFTSHYALTAFSIPFGYAVYTPGGTIHDDGFLLGRFLVIYSITDTFSTALIRDAADAVVPVSIQNLKYIQSEQQTPTVSSRQR
jgi:hypothetical protein